MVRAMRQTFKRKDAKKAAADKKPAGERSNKKAPVVGMMQGRRVQPSQKSKPRPGWAKHTIRGFVSLLGSKGGYKVDYRGRSARRVSLAA